MTKEHFYLTSTLCILPAIADQLEDLPFTFRAKQLQNETVRAIRRLDKHFMDVASIGVIDEQNQIQRAFLQWLELQWEEIQKTETI
jgi:hypothetical protein